MADRNPYQAFDWEFTDRLEQHSARHDALQAKPEETRTLMSLVSADSLVSFALWSELPEGHPVRELWLETNTDILATIYLAYGGFFRQALSVLRCWLEIGIHGVFFSAHYGQPNERYEQWRRGQRNAPANMQKLARAFAARRDKLTQVDEAVFLGKLYDPYTFLSCQTHAQGLDTHNLQDGRDNVPRFLPRSFDVWYENALKVFDALCFLYNVFYADRIACYLSRSEAERQHASELAASLGGLIPDFGSLMGGVFLRLQGAK